MKAAIPEAQYIITRGSQTITIVDDGSGNSLGGQILGRSMLGIGHAIGQKSVYDQHYGVPLAVRFHHNRPPTILDAPQHMAWDAVNIPDPETPIGAKGIGEPPVGAGAWKIGSARRATSR